MRGTLPDGTPGFIGLLRLCDDVDGPQPCIQSIGPSSTEGPAFTVIVVLIPDGFTADPHMHA